jgi:hypothetical protein
MPTPMIPHHGPHGEGSPSTGSAQAPPHVRAAWNFEACRTNRASPIQIIDAATADGLRAPHIARYLRGLAHWQRKQKRITDIDLSLRDELAFCVNELAYAQSAEERDVIFRQMSWLLVVRKKWQAGKWRSPKGRKPEPAYAQSADEFARRVIDQVRRLEQLTGRPVPQERLAQALAWSRRTLNRYAKRFELDIEDLIRQARQP